MGKAMQARIVGAVVFALGLAVTGSLHAQDKKEKAKELAAVTKVLLENDKVRVREVVFAPGAGDTHTHPWAHVGVILTKGQLAFADAGKPEEVVDFEAGSVGFREAKVTHLARNPGKIPMKVIEVEVK
jgi:mannose-6-phosphate isomerase-like protein (cupin superfamily)